MLSKFISFVNESELNKLSKEDLEEIKTHFFSKLDQYEEHLLSNIEFDPKTKEVVYREDPPIDFDRIIKKLKRKFGNHVVSELNAEAFFRKIQQILEFRRKDTIKFIQKEFKLYKESFYGRVKSEEEDIRNPHFDEYEEEHSKIHRRTYEIEKYQLDVELSKLQRWVEKNKKRVCIVFEGRDSAGKGSAIKRFVERMNPRVFRVVALGVPTEEDKKNWFRRYERYLPNPGEVILFDRSWYNRAVVEPAMGYCTENQYNDFMDNVINWEENLIKDGVILIKFWFSITKEKQQSRFNIRQKSPIKYWKYSPNDAAVVNKWDVITKYKDLMFNKTSSPKSPWVVINANDKRIGRLNSIRYVLNKIPYTDKKPELLHWYPEVITVIE